MSDSFYITTPIYYVNDAPHIGHAYTTIACDVMARFYRLMGNEVHFLTGTDEHGQKVEKTAASIGLTPQECADKNSQKFRALVCDSAREDGGENALGVSNHDFIRTTEPRHIKAAQALWQRLADSGSLYLENYGGWYSVRDEAYYQEAELIDGKAPTGAPVEWVEEPSYFFRLSDYQEKLLQYYKNNPEFIFPQSRYNEVVRFVEGGLKDLSVSRTSFSWGVPVPGDSQHIMYVWLDALANYLTALGFPDLNAQLYKRFWGNAFHVVGKDILRFHAVYWPAFLMAADLPLPKKIIAHGWWTNEGQKISKSLGNVIDPHGLLQEFGRDATRYFLMREVPFGQDGNFAREQMIMRMNAELANNIGNLCQRTLSFVQKHTGGNVPLAGELSAEDKNLRTRCRDNSRYLRAMNGSVFSEALEETIELAMSANQYIDQQAPWNLKKQGDEKRLATVLATLLEALHALAVRLQPFIPEASEAMLIQLGYTPETAARGVMLQNITKGYTYVGALPAPSPVFPRFLEK